MNNEMKINTDARLRKIKNMVRILPLSTLPGLHLNMKGMSPKSSTFNMLNNTNDDAKEEK